MSAAADLVVVGCGPAGMAAACEARALGLSVIVLDEQPALGGQIYRNIEATPADRIAVLGKDYEAGRSLAAEFRGSGAGHLHGAVVWNVAPNGAVDYVADGRLRQVVGKAVLLASGAMERPFPIRGWTLPGVLGAGAAQILLKGSGALPSGPVVLAGCGPLLYLLAWQYLRAGVTIAAIVDTTAGAGYLSAIRHGVGAVRGWRDLAKGLKLIATLRRHGVRFHSGASDLAIQGERQAEGLSFVHRGRRVTLPASLVLLHQSVVPNTQLSWSTGRPTAGTANSYAGCPRRTVGAGWAKRRFYVAGDSAGRSSVRRPRRPRAGCRRSPSPSVPAATSTPAVARRSSLYLNGKAISGAS